MVTKKVKKRKSNKNLFFDVLFFIIILSVFLFFLFSNINIAKKRLSLINKIDSLNKAIEKLKDEKAKLETGLSDTKTDDYWEEVIRDQGYVKQGEKSVIVLPSKKQSIQNNEKVNFLNSLLKEIKKLFNW